MKEVNLETITNMQLWCKTYSMDSILSVQNKNFAGSRKELAKVLGAVQEAKSHLHGQFFGIWQSW